MNDPIPAVSNAPVDWKWCQARGKPEALVMKTIHVRNAISNHSSMFTYHIRFILRGGEDYRLGQGSLIESTVGNAY